MYLVIVKGAAPGVVKLGEWVCYYDVSNIVNLRALNGGIDESIVRHHLLWRSSCL